MHKFELISGVLIVCAVLGCCDARNCMHSVAQTIGVCTPIHECVTANELFGFGAGLPLQFCANNAATPLVCCLDNVNLAHSNKHPPRHWFNRPTNPPTTLPGSTGTAPTEVAKDDGGKPKAPAPAETVNSRTQSLKPTAESFGFENDDEDGTTTPFNLDPRPLDTERFTSKWPKPTKPTSDGTVELNIKLSSEDQSDVPEKCVDKKTGQSGVCKPFADCTTMLSGDNIQVCGFSLDIPTVCCVENFDEDIIVFPSDDYDIYSYGLDARKMASAPAPYPQAGRAKLDESRK